MASIPNLAIAVFDGDGIGPEIIPPTLELLQQAVALSGGPEPGFEMLPAGATTYRKTGVALPAESVERARQADAILLSAMGDPEVRHPDGTELIPQVELRFELGLYAGIRPVRSIPGVPGVLADPRAGTLDFVLVRESIEGLFAPSRPATVSPDEATETMLITRENSEQLFRTAFEIAERRRIAGYPGRVTCIDKANVFPAFAFFRSVFDEVSQECAYQALEFDSAYVDAMAMNLVSAPWEYDVMVTENLLGDILSDLGAALVGGMGYAPSADIGREFAVFQPCHGSAPDIASSGMANPTAMFLSAAMMLDWLAERQAPPYLREAARLIRTSVDQAFGSGQLVTCERGGQAGLAEVAHAVSDAMSKQRA